MVSLKPIWTVQCIQCIVLIFHIIPKTLHLTDVMTAQSSDTAPSASAFIRTPSCKSKFVLWAVTLEPRLPDGNSQISRLYVLAALKSWTMAPRRYTTKFDPFLSMDCAPCPALQPSAIQGKEGIKLCHLTTL